MGCFLVVILCGKVRISQKLGGYMNKVLVFTLCLYASTVQANDSLNSELSHVAGGAAMGAGFTYLADYYGEKELRGWIGFGTAAGIGVLGEAIELASGNGEFSALDAGSNALGAAIGAFVTDQWVLMPVVNSRDHYVGITGRIPLAL